MYFIGCNLTQFKLNKHSIHIFEQMNRMSVIKIVACIVYMFVFSCIAIAQVSKQRIDTSSSYTIKDIVITGTKTFKRKTETPVIVNILDNKSLNQLQVCNLSEGLKFQPGLRVETDCQTCNYTQLRMNGLQGSYSQILINGRPVFSPLMGLYGMEQIPVNMIERIEVVRGGGSSLYGSSAIGGTVNIITKLPQKTGFELNSFYQNINGQTNDFNFNGNATVLDKSGRKGISLYVSKRDRDFFDANNDQFSEISKMENTAVGFNTFYKINESQKLELSFCNLLENRIGGEMVDKPVYLTQQSEERKHRIWMGNIDYQINFNKNKSSFILYSAFQETRRNHYTGIFPNDSDAIQKHLANPPFGSTYNLTLQGGFQLNHQLNNFFRTKNILTIGAEVLSDQVKDAIAAYSYSVNQYTKDIGLFIQSDWDITSQFNLLSGVRVDKHNLLEDLVMSPRVAALFKLNRNTQLRMNYGTGFRAPQAFDTDLHISFASGGVSRVQLLRNLQQEHSQSFSISLNADKISDNWIAGYTLDLFHTELMNAFVLEQIGEDVFGKIFEKRNGQSAIVQGVTLELRANYNRRIQIEAGFTIQKSEFETPVEYIKGIEPVKMFLRTPNDYGFANLNVAIGKRNHFNLNYVYTGEMKLAHFAGADNVLTDQITTTKAFSDLSTKIARTFNPTKSKFKIDIYGGIKNVFNAYQIDFDKGKNRDSNYIYGPSLPRTFFIGFKIML